MPGGPLFARLSVRTTAATVRVPDRDGSSLVCSVHVRAPDRPGRTEPAHRSSPPAGLQAATHNDTPHVRLSG